MIRTKEGSYFPLPDEAQLAHRFALATNGALGFVTRACISTNEGPFFVPFYFCRDFIQFLGVAIAYFEKIHYYGSCMLNVNFTIPRARLYDGTPGFTSNNIIAGARLFEPPLHEVAINLGMQIPVALHPMTAERLQETIHVVLNDLIRSSGSVLSPAFEKCVQPLADDLIKKLRN